MEFLGSEASLRLSVFVGIFLIMALLELMIPKRKLNHPKSHRWLTNLMIAGIDSLIIRLMAMLTVPLVAVAAAFWVQ